MMKDYLVTPLFNLAAMTQAAAQAKTQLEKADAVNALRKQAYDDMHGPVTAIVTRTGGKVFNETPDAHMGVTVTDEAAEQIRNLKNAKGEKLVEQVVENVMVGQTSQITELTLGGSGHLVGGSCAMPSAKNFFKHNK